MLANKNHEDTCAAVGATWFAGCSILTISFLFFSFFNFICKVTVSAPSLTFPHTWRMNFCLDNAPWSWSHQPARVDVSKSCYHHFNVSVVKILLEREKISEVKAFRFATPSNRAWGSTFYRRYIFSRPYLFTKAFLCALFLLLTWKL